MEQVFTDYLKKIGAYVPGSRLKRFDAGRMPFPVEASVIIPVRNRKETIAEAVASGLSQKTAFPFNVIVVDNYSTDGTTSVLRDARRREPQRSITSFPRRPASPSAAAGMRRFDPSLAAAMRCSSIPTTFTGPPMSCSG